MLFRGQLQLFVWAQVDWNKLKDFMFLPTDKSSPVYLTDQSRTVTSNMFLISFEALSLTSFTLESPPMMGFHEQ